MRLAVAYSLMLASAAAIVYGITEAGTSLVAPPPIGASAYGREAAIALQFNTLAHVLLALAVVIALARAVGAVFRYLGQPPVIGEVVAGIMIGPSLLGQISPEAMRFIQPTSVGPPLFVLAQIGVVLYMFLVGLELDAPSLRKASHTALAVSHAGIVVPFLLGAGLSLWLYPTLSTADVPFRAFALFLGLAMSITAFPVLARILTDRGLQRTDLGRMALVCAAVDDVTAWCLLAFVSSMVSAREGSAIWTAVLTVAYIALIITVIRPALARYCDRVDRKGAVGQGDLAVTLIAVLVSAVVAEYIGIHAIFGAFLLGAAIPHDSLIGRNLHGRMEDLVMVLLLPAFFAYTGMRTSIGLVSTPMEWAMCLAIVAVACVGKLGGSFVAARLTGFSTRTSLSLGLLMNTRGLMELIVLNVGLDLGVLGPTLFAMMVIMALVTTMMTGPLVQWISPDGGSSVP